MQNDGEHHALYDDIYRIWNYQMSSKFKKDCNPRVSTLNYLEESTDLNIICQQVDQWAVGFSTKLGEELSIKFNISDVLIDSTFKTNNESLELFVLIGFVVGVGFPLAYYILSPGTSIRSREESLTTFLSGVKARLSDLRPSFFHRQGDIADICNSIRL